MELSLTLAHHTVVKYHASEGKSSLAKCPDPDTASPTVCFLSLPPSKITNGKKKLECEGPGRIERGESHLLIASQLIIYLVPATKHKQ